MLFGSGAVLFWSSVVCAIVIFAVAAVAKGKTASTGHRLVEGAPSDDAQAQVVDAAKPGKITAFIILAVIAVPVLSVALRALVYVLAYPTVLFY